MRLSEKRSRGSRGMPRGLGSERSWSREWKVGSARTRRPQGGGPPFHWCCANPSGGSFLRELRTPSRRHADVLPVALVVDPHAEEPDGAVVLVDRPCAQQARVLDRVVHVHVRDAKPMPSRTRQPWVGECQGVAVQPARRTAFTQMRNALHSARRPSRSLWSAPPSPSREPARRRARLHRVREALRDPMGSSPNRATSERPSRAHPSDSDRHGHRERESSGSRRLQSESAPSAGRSHTPSRSCPSPG